MAMCVSQVFSLTLEKNVIVLRKAVLTLPVLKILHSLQLMAKVLLPLFLTHIDFRIINNAE